ncbi:MAG: gliding motility protein GldC [Flavobacteriales bacterium]|jgi:gliding motility-associated protein GldC|nr:gliding motility protein GldC [Flavobacteriales bacterium]
MAVTTSKIEFNVSLDENQIPEKILWTAEDNKIIDAETNAILLSVWDSKNRETLKMDLWTKEMPVHDMKVFFYQTLKSLADTFQRATNDEKMSATMHDFCDFFAEKQGLKSKED